MPENRSPGGPCLTQGVPSPQRRRTLRCPPEYWKALRNWAEERQRPGLPGMLQGRSGCGPQGRSGGRGAARNAERWSCGIDWRCDSRRGRGELRGWNTDESARAQTRGPRWSGCGTRALPPGGGGVGSVLREGVGGWERILWLPRQQGLMAAGPDPPGG